MVEIGDHWIRPERVIRALIEEWGKRSGPDRVHRLTIYYIPGTEQIEELYAYGTRAEIEPMCLKLREEIGTS